jgi:NADPH-dependent ferric siderophore reductase
MTAQWDMIGLAQVRATGVVVGFMLHQQCGQLDKWSARAAWGDMAVLAAAAKMIEIKTREKTK